MKHLSKYIVKYKYIILGAFIIVFIASMAAMFYVNINSDIISYLPENMETTDGYKFLKENFDIEGDAMLAVDNVSFEQMSGYIEEIKKIEGLKEGGVVWYGTFDEMMAEMGGIGGIIGQDKLDEILAGIKNSPDVHAMFLPKGVDGNCYSVMLQLNVPVSSPEAMNLTKSIGKMFDSDNVPYAFGGSTAIATQILNSTMSEMGMYMIVGILLIVIILILATPSFFEPIILLLTLGVSVLINIGTNIILPSVSIITFAASSILQIALSMDYAIFLMHAYAKERETSFDNGEAMRRAIPKTFSTITASALTTIGGFLALFFMKFEIGADLGIVLAKGVFLSLLTVVFLQPCLILTFTKILDKTRHKEVMLKFDFTASSSIKYKKIIAVVAVAIIIPAIIGQMGLEYSYIKMDKKNAEITEMQETVNVLGNSVVLCVPQEDAATNTKYIKQLKKIDNVIAVNSIFSMFPEKDLNLIELALQISPELFKDYVNNGFVLYFVSINVDSEAPEASVLLENIKAVTNNSFGTKYYITGMTQAVSDLAEITPKDFTVVNIVSIIIILLVLLFTLRSLKLSAILILVVEAGIFINLALSSFMGDKINFMAYIIISSIQLGATIDYAILYTVKFKQNLETLGVKESSFKAVRESGSSILTSTAIIAGVCFAVYFISSNRIVGEITLLIGRGAIISSILVLFVLPALVMMVTRKVKPIRHFMLKKSKRLKESK